MLRVTDEHRRARIARRHGLHPDHRHADVASATAAMTALHATEPSTPHLALHARVDGLTPDVVEAALYDERALVKVMAMRRTLWVIERELLPAVVGSAGRRVADAERRRLEQEARQFEAALGPDWIAAASDRLVEHLHGVELSARQLRDTIPDLGGTFLAGPGTKWAAEVPVMNRLLTILTAGGQLVRGHNASHWRVSRPQWTSMRSWLGVELDPLEQSAAYADVVRRLLWTFGPVTETDLVWWLGATKTIVRNALSAVEATPVLLPDDQQAWVSSDDTGDLESPPDVGPWVALLPTLDPTTMGWKQRGFYLDTRHAPYLFDSAGNGGTTVWVDGRVVGCWVQLDDGRVETILLEEIGRDATRRLDRERQRLDEFLRGERITNVFASPQMKRRPLG